MTLVDIEQMGDCDTCFHHRGGKCSPSIWCDYGESYRPDFTVLAAKAKKVVNCKDCKFYEKQISWCELFSTFTDEEKTDWIIFDEDDFCSQGVMRNGRN